MRFSSTSLLASLLLLTSILTGCAAVVQKPIPLDQTFWSAKEQTIGVAITKLPPPELVLTGNQGVLDILVNKGVNSGLSQQISQWELKDFDSLPDEIVAKLVAKGYKAKRVPGSLDMAAYKPIKDAPLGYAKTDLTPLKQAYGIDRLLLIYITATGATRSYYSIIPTSAPLAQVGGQGLAIDLNDNKLIWFQPFASVLPAQGSWDDNHYANLSNAFYQAVDNSRQMMITPFAQ